MKSKNEETAVLIWLEADKSQEKSEQTQEKNVSKVIELDDYRQAQKFGGESTILSWDIPSVEANQTVKLTMISSGFTARSFSKGNTTIQSMAA